MGTSSAPEFPFPGGEVGKEPADPVAGKPGHFAWSRWIKEFIKRLDRDSVKNSGDTMTGPLIMKNGATEVTVRVEGSSLSVSHPVRGGEPYFAAHLATKNYVDTRIPQYHEVTITANSSGWAAPSGLKAGAVVFSILDTSSTPSTVPLMLNPANNNVYLGPSATRRIRFWYV
jgi:hypothetical protein